MAIYRTIRAKKIKDFRAEVWRYWKKSGRHNLPWRTTKNPYRILVSEVMLQQTQVVRVEEKYKEFLKAFPTVEILARAPLGRVLRVWSGMGYNRRAKYLRDMAKVILEEYGGRIPKDAAALRALPGVGPYTASAVRVFAFNKPDVLIETNIRAAFIHFFYASVLQNTSIEDRQILPIATVTAKGQDPQTWHWALMDYGVHIKKLHENPSRKSAHYVRQSKFEGSLRQVRGAILRALADDGKTQKSIHFLIRAQCLSVALREGGNKKVVDKALAGLARDGLIHKQGGKWKV